MSMIHTDGKDIGPVLLYALSTCGWCKKTRAFMQEQGIAFDVIEVDRLKGEERKTTISELAKFNPAMSFPTLIIGEQCIIGFKEDQIKAAISL
ncbi:MAG: glutaredoxin family protein [Solirubrobacterales bacterium]